MVHTTLDQLLARPGFNSQVLWIIVVKIIGVYVCVYVYKNDIAPTLISVKPKVNFTEFWSPLLSKLTAG